MSLINKIKEKQQLQKNKLILDENKLILDGNIYCEKGKEKEFMEVLKTKFPEFIPLIKAGIELGMIDGLRNVSFKLNNE